MEAAAERLAGLPFSEVVLWTLAGNDRAIAFYERQGWRADGAEKIHDRSGARAVRYRRPR